MSGGGGGDHGESGILEASPGALAILVVAFLVLTLGLEKLLHWLRHYLRRRNKRGLLAAVNNLASELMLLAVASLFLTALEPAVTRICVPAASLMPPWISNVQGCACCLARTQGISSCFLQDRHCPADMAEQCGEHPPAKNPFAKKIKYATNGTAAAEAPGAHTAAPSTAVHGRRRRRLAAAAPPGNPSVDAVLDPATADALYQDYCVDQHVECAGPVQAAYKECDYKPGLAPAFTGETLEQVHMLLFVMAVIHIIVSVLVLVASSYKLRYWAWVSGRADEDALAATALKAAAAESSTGPGRTSSTTAAAAESAPGQQDAAIVTMPTDADSVADAASGASDLAVGPRWKGRPAQLKGVGSWLLEGCQLLLRQLLFPAVPTVSRQEYSVLRASFYYTHNRPHPGSASMTSRQQSQAAAVASPATAVGQTSALGHKSVDTQLPPDTTPATSAAAPPHAPPCVPDLFAPYLSECLERDGSQVVGLGLPMWVLVTCFVLLSGAIGWSTWLFLIVAGALLLLLNTTLLFAMRAMTAGGCVRQQTCVPWFLQHPSLLMSGIKFLLFFLSFVISNAVYFAAFFGAESCFFSRTGFQKESPVSWWVIMLLDVYLLLSLALVTLPTYCVARHTFKADRKLLAQLARRQRHARKDSCRDSGSGTESD